MQRFVMVFGVLCGFAVVPRSVGATCRICEHVIQPCSEVFSNPDDHTVQTIEYCEGKPYWHEFQAHFFFDQEGTYCNENPVGACRVCGSGLGCHLIIDLGDCHLPCSGGGGNLALIGEIERANVSGDVAKLASLLSSGAGASFDSGRAVIRIESACAGTDAREIRLRPVVSSALAAEVELLRPEG